MSSRQTTNPPSAPLNDDWLSTVFLKTKSGKTLCAAALGFLALLAFGPSWDLGWAFDDLDYLDNARKGASDLLYVIDAEKPWASRPLVHLYFLAVFPLFGENPVGYHVLNVIWHVACSYLCFQVGLVVLGMRRSEAILTGLLFFLNVSHFRAIYWVSGVSLMMATVSGLIAVLVSARHSGGSRVDVAMAVSLCVAVFSHEGAFVFAVPAAYLRWTRCESWEARLRSLICASLPLIAMLMASVFYFPTPLSRETNFGLGWHVVTNIPVMFFRGISGSHWDIWRSSEPSTAEILLGSVLLVALLFSGRFNRRLMWLGLWVSLAAVPFAPWPEAATVSRYYYMLSTGVSGLLAIALCLICRNWRVRSWGLAVLFVFIASVSIHHLWRVRAVQYAYSGEFHYKTEVFDVAARQYSRSISTHIYPENAAQIQRLHVASLLKDGQVSRAYGAVLPLLVNYPNHRPLYPLALRAYSIHAGVVQSNDTEHTNMDGLIKLLTEYLKRDIRDAEQSGDRQTAAGLKRLHGYYLSFAGEDAGVGER